MTGRAVLRLLSLLVLAVATTVGVVAVALLATDLDRHVRALAVLPSAVLVQAVAGVGLLATRQGAR